MARLLIVGEIGLYREGLAVALSQYDEFQEVLTASDLSAALRSICESPPDVIVVDFVMSFSLATIRSLTEVAEDSVLDPHERSNHPPWDLDFEIERKVIFCHSSLLGHLEH